MASQRRGARVAGEPVDGVEMRSRRDYEPSSGSRVRFGSVRLYERDKHILRKREEEIVFDALLNEIRLM